MQWSACLVLCMLSYSLSDCITNVNSPRFGGYWPEGMDRFKLSSSETGEKLVLRVSPTTDFNGARCIPFGFMNSKGEYTVQDEELFLGWGRIRLAPPMGADHPRFWFVPDGREEGIFLAGDADVGGLEERVWVSGVVKKERLEVKASERLPSKLKEIKTSVRNETVAAELVQIRAACNHLNNVPGENNRKLNLRIKVQNQNGKPLEITIRRVFVSFNKEKEGMPIEGVSFWDWNRKAEIISSLTLEPKQALSDLKNIDPELRAKKETFGEGHHGEKLYVLLILSVGEETLVLRNHGTVE